MKSRARSVSLVFPFVEARRINLSSPKGAKSKEQVTSSVQVFFQFCTSSMAGIGT